MKWFKHDTNAHTNLKLQKVFDNLGVEAYGYYWVCVELVGLQGENFVIKSEKSWKKYIHKMTGLDTPTQEKYLKAFSDEGLIDKKAYKQGHLYIPKFGERADDYTKRVRRVSEQSTNNVHLEEKRTDKNRIEQLNKLKSLKEDLIKKKSI